MDTTSHIKLTTIWAIDHFTVVCLVAWPSNESEAGDDCFDRNLHAFLMLMLLFSC